ncbi:hypothetical protein DLAC_08266 [Tieghemostelium lacteum]|uniref:Uncharacterized protein n=1 Tax=Tieghemostelium lacteum TaxID=361077 RepID=A0A151ZBJ7_TIELA|nr:hypothetical protein DLAC_08266 [Tieghemostelium lacteum]|eukprot:KYQ91320.1 hypothetical protein DLAC_08266 [Tieghemostelium lacteum]
MYQLLQTSSASLERTSNGRSPSQMDELLLLLENTYITKPLHKQDCQNDSPLTSPISTAIIHIQITKQPLQQQQVPQQFSKQEDHIPPAPVQLEKDLQDEMESEKEINTSSDSQEEDDEEVEDDDSEYEESSEEEEDDEEDDESYESEEEENEESEIEDEEETDSDHIKTIRKSSFFKSNDDDDDNESDSESEQYDYESEYEETSDNLIINEFEELIPNYSFNYVITPPKDTSQSPCLQAESDDEEMDIDSTEYQERMKLSLLEKDKDILNSIRSSSPNPIKFIPTWFGNEDEQMIKLILREYQDYLFREHEIESEDQCIRSPKPFIGRVHRRPIQFHSSDCEFVTLDTVKVFRWDIQPIGRPLKIHKSFVFLTHWDVDSGLPVRFQKILSLSNKDLWQREYKSTLTPSSSSNSLSSMISCSSATSSSRLNSYIYCSPIFDSDSEYQYSVHSDKYPIDYLPRSSPKLARRRNFSHPSLLLTSHIYSHSLIPQDEFNFKNLNNTLDSAEDDCNF